MKWYHEIINYIIENGVAQGTMVDEMINLTSRKLFILIFSVAVLMNETISWNDQLCKEKWVCSRNHGWWSDKFDF